MTETLLLPAGVELGETTIPWLGMLLLLLALAALTALVVLLVRLRRAERRAEEEPGREPGRARQAALDAVSALTRDLLAERPEPEEAHCDRCKRDVPRWFYQGAANCCLHCESGGIEPHPRDTETEDEYVEALKARHALWREQEAAALGVERLVLWIKEPRA